MASACGDSESNLATPAGTSASGIAVDQVATGEAPDDTTVLGPMASAGNLIFALAATEGSVWASGIVRSLDPGEPWEPVALPDAPEPSPTGNFTWDLQAIDRGVFVSAAEATPAGTILWAWSSSNGTDWTGGRIGAFRGASPYARFDNVGDSVVRVIQRNEAVVVLHTLDAGKSWHEAPIAGLAVLEGESAGLAGGPWTTPTGQVRMLVSYSGETSRGFENVSAEAPSPDGPWTVVDPMCPQNEQVPRGHCYPSVEAGTLRARGIEVSLDAGRTWADATFRQPLDRDPHRVVSGFSSLTSLPTGGWIGTVDGYVPAGGGPLAWVLHSTDGRTWSALLGPGQNGCTRSPVDTDQPWAQAHPPLLAGDAAVAAFTCPGAGSGLYRIDTDTTPVHQVEPNQRLGEPFQHGGTVVAPVRGVDDEAIRSFVVVQP